MPSIAAQGEELLSSLQGRWKAVYQEVDGQMVPNAEYATTLVELNGNEFKVEKHGAVEYDGLFTVDPLTSPMEISLIYKKSSKPIFLGGARPGVFQLEGDTLKWCFGPIGHPTPKGLNTFPGSEAVFSIYQREPSKVKGKVQSLFRGGIVW